MGALILASVQWFVFLVANVLTVPIVLGHSFGFSPAQIAHFTDRSLFICGLIGLLQALFGHRYAVLEGPAGMWWGVFLVLIYTAKSMHVAMATLLQQIELGLIIAALVLMGLGAMRLLGVIRALFTPVVTGTFLVLLALQISQSLVEGVLGIGYRGASRVSPEIALLSLAIMGLTMLLMFKATGILKSVAVLIGLLFGALLYSVLGLVNPPSGQGGIVYLPSVFPFGPPTFNLGVVITCVLTALILLSNLIASVQTFAAAADVTPSDQTYDRGTLFTGLGTALSGLFGAVGLIPLSSSAGLVSLTGMASRSPFVIASAALAFLGLFPYLGNLAASLPGPVGFAVLFAVIVQLLGFGLRDFKRLTLNQRDVFVVGMPLLIGAGILFVPGSAWFSLPPLFGYILGNGLIIGILLALCMEHLIFREHDKPSELRVQG